MRAARYYGTRDVRVEDIEVPTPGKGQILVETAWCGLCGSDLKNYVSAPGLYGTPTKDRPDRHTGSVLPVTLGHEACGRVFQTTPGCPLAVGQPVVVDPHLFCSKCHHCETSNNLCDDFGFLGLSGGGGGGFSQYFAVDWRACHPVPESLLGVACLIEPLAVARRALHRVGSCDWSSKTALILGGGPIGQAVLWNLRSFGCQNILCSEPAAIRQQQVKRAGGVVIDPSKADAVTVVQQTTGSRGADVVFDCAGLQSALDLGMAVLSKHGQYVMVASWSKPIMLDLATWMGKEISLEASLAYTTEDFRSVVDDFLQGKFKGVEDMITARIHVDDIVEKGFEALIQRPAENVKILVSSIMK